MSKRPLIKTNPYLKDKEKYISGLRRFVSSSSVIEGIHIGMTKEEIKDARSDRCEKCPYQNHKMQCLMSTPYFKQIHPFVWEIERCSIGGNPRTGEKDPK